MTPLTVTTASAGETRALGERVGTRLQRGAVLLLHGDLGAGKTTFTQGVARGLGIDDYVQSPTFTLVSEHRGSAARDEPIGLYHLDLYRLATEEDLESFGYDEYLAPEDGVTVIEWPERAGDWLPDAYLAVDFRLAGPDRREITLAVVGGDEALERAVADLVSEALPERPVPGTVT